MANTITKEIETATTFQVNTNLNTTHIVGYRKTAYQINEAICAMIRVQKNKFLISNCIDIYNGNTCNNDIMYYLFKKKTNLPEIVRIQPGARVKFLNNTNIKTELQMVLWVL